MTKISLYIGMSLDGYIADENGGVDWMLGDGSEPDHPGTYETFLATVDTVIMGKKTYDQISQTLSPDSWPYPNQQTYVLTHEPLKSHDRVTFTDKSLTELLSEVNSEHIWICGGANLVQQAMDADLIDTYHISILPVILGKGIKLFTSELQRLLQLETTMTYNGIVDLVYQRKG